MSLQPKHSLLRRQLKQHWDDESVPSGPWVGIIEAIDQAYVDFDVDREMLERSLELSSQELLQATSELRAVFQAIPDLLLRITHDGTIIALKVGTQDDLLLQGRELMGKKLDQLPFPEAAARLQLAAKEVARTRGVIAVEYSLRLGERENHYEARLAPALEDQIVIIVRNITAQKQAEEELRTTRLRLERLLAKSPTVVYSLTIRGDVVTASYWSENLKTMLGYDTAEALQPHWWREHVHPDDLAGAGHQIARLLEQGQVAHDYRFRHANGTYRWLRDEQRLLRDCDQRAVEIVGAWSDVTDRLELEGRLRQSQKMDAIGQLAGGVAHDFNNLLTVVKGCTQLVLTERLGNEESRQLLREVFDAANRAGQLTQQLLAFSRTHPIQTENIDINAVVAELSRMLQRLIGADVTMKLDCAPDVPIVRADTGMLEQVLLNLVVNARDAMPDGGQLHVATSRVVLTPEKVRIGRAIGEFARITVRDTGSGMSPETVSRIFEPFFTTKAPGKGTGLGLATVYGITEQHQGWIEVESEVGKGSLFAVYLPAAPGGSKARIPAASNGPAPKGTETILLVEDDASVRQLGRIVLQRAGYRVHEARNSIAALELWNQHQGAIAALVTDVVLPDGPSGIQLARQLKTIRADLPIVFTTGYPGAANKLELAQWRSAKILLKPYLPSALAKIVRDCLDAAAP